jgi:hypothetical protein
MAKAANAAATEGPTIVWTVSNLEELGIQAVALMQGAGVMLPSGDLEDFVSLTIPRTGLFGVLTEFEPWDSTQAQARVAQGGTRNLGEVRLGDHVQEVAIRAEFPNLTANQVRLLQLRGLIHQFFHVTDFAETLDGVGGNYDAAIALQHQHIGRMPHLPGYARNEIYTDVRTHLVLERNKLLFPELRQSHTNYIAMWLNQGPMSEQQFDAVLNTLHRSRYP